MAVVSIKWASLLDPNKQPSLQDATGFAPVVPTPTFTSATTSSYTAAITGYDAQFTYTVSASVGSAVRTDGNVTVSGLTANQSSTLTVTAANTARDLSFSSSAAFLSLPATPTLTQTGQTTSSVTVTIGNYDAGLTYTIGSSAGSATRSTNTITVTGLSEGQTVTVTATASNSSGNSAQGSVSATSLALPTGGTITTPGDGFRYHTFTSSGTFVNPTPRTVGYLIYAGGGGGGSAINGEYVASPLPGNGGGAGGRIFSSSAPLNSGTYPIVVGGGGSGGIQPPSFTGSTLGTPGSNSTFNSLTAIGGGRAGQYSAPTPAHILQWGTGSSGGSGGASIGGYPRAQIPSGGAGTPGQGSPGGIGPDTSAFYGSGGGGSGGSGGNGSTAIPMFSGAPGGAGLTDFGIARGGGGAGAGGGGSNGTASAGGGANGSSGAANTGGGGSGATYLNGASGGSGIVIVRYPV